MEQDVKEKIEFFNVRLMELKKEFKEEIDRLISESLNGLEPYVKSIYIMAYVPGFNDGEPCEYTIEGPNVVFNYEGEGEGEDEDFDYYEGHSYYSIDDFKNFKCTIIPDEEKSYVIRRHNQKAKEIEKLRSLFKTPEAYAKFFNSKELIAGCLDEYIVRNSYGTNVRVQWSPGNVESEVVDYDCGY